MKIQSINQPVNQSFNQGQNPSFQKLIVKKGSFDALKQSKYFPERDYPNYAEHLRKFYEKLVQLKKTAEKNTLYNVVIKPENEKFSRTGKMVIENSDGVEQYGFKSSFDDILSFPEMEPKKTLTEREEPNLFDRVFKNWQINRENKKLANKPLDMQKFLDTVYKKLEDMVNSADYLAELNKIKGNK